MALVRRLSSIAGAWITQNLTQLMVKSSLVIICVWLVISSLCTICTLVCFPLTHRTFVFFSPVSNVVSLDADNMIMAFWDTCGLASVIALSQLFFTSLLTLDFSLSHRNVGSGTLTLEVHSLLLCMSWMLQTPLVWTKLVRLSKSSLIRIISVVHCLTRRCLCVFVFLFCVV